MAVPPPISVVRISSPTDCCWQCGDVEVEGFTCQCCGSSEMLGFAYREGTDLYVQAECRFCEFLHVLCDPKRVPDVQCEIDDRREEGKRDGVDCGSCDCVPPKKVSTGNYIHCEDHV